MYFEELVIQSVFWIGLVGDWSDFAICKLQGLGGKGDHGLEGSGLLKDY